MKVLFTQNVFLLSGIATVDAIAKQQQRTELREFSRYVSNNYSILKV